MFVTSRTGDRPWAIGKQAIGNRRWAIGYRFEAIGYRKKL
jgi:hypothetical protein